MMTRLLEHNSDVELSNFAFEELDGEAIFNNISW
jgi:hypothetical protein